MPNHTLSRQGSYPRLGQGYGSGSNRNDSSRGSSLDLNHQPNDLRERYETDFKRKFSTFYKQGNAPGSGIVRGRPSTTNFQGLFLH